MFAGQRVSLERRGQRRRRRSQSSNDEDDPANAKTHRLERRRSSDAQVGVGMLRGAGDFRISNFHVCNGKFAFVYFGECQFRSFQFGNVQAGLVQFVNFQFVNRQFGKCYFRHYQFRNVQFGYVQFHVSNM